MARRGVKKSVREVKKKTELDSALWSKFRCPYLKDVLLTASASDAQQWRAASHRVKKFIEESREHMPLPQPPKPKIEAPPKSKTELLPPKALLPSAKKLRIPEMLRSEMQSRLLRHPVKLTVDAESPVARYRDTVTKNGKTFSLDFELTLRQEDSLDVTLKARESCMFNKMTRKNKKKNNTKNVKAEEEVVSKTLSPSLWRNFRCKFLKDAVQCASAKDATRWLTVSKRVKAFIEENRATMPLHNCGTINISIGRFEMLLGHCPHKITKQIEIALPETKVEDASTEPQAVVLQRMGPPSQIISQTSSWKCTATNLDFALMTIVKRFFDWYELYGMNITNLPPSCFATIKEILEEAPPRKHEIGLIIRYKGDYDVTDLFLDENQIAELSNLLRTKEIEVTCDMKAPLAIPATLMEKPCIAKLTEIWLTGIEMPITAKHLESLSNLVIVDLRLEKPKITAIEFHESMIRPWFGGGWKKLKAFTISVNTAKVHCESCLFQDVVGRLPMRGKYYRDAAKCRRMDVDVVFSLTLGGIHLKIYHDNK